MGRIGKYEDYRRRILDHLCTKTDTGYAVITTLREACAIPKSSIFDVISGMEVDGLVKRRPTVLNKEILEVTSSGRAEYARLLREVPGEYVLPYSVRRYMRERTPKVTKLFPIQSSFVERGLLHKSSNACVFGYPASGKTFIAEICTVDHLTNKGKVLYCTPYKALDWQKYQDFKAWFGGRMGASVLIADGDNPISDVDLQHADIVISTYERVGEALRRGEKWIDHVTLFCVDEITHLAEDERGANLDLLLSSMKSLRNPPRIITLSSLVGNPMEISDWLKAVPVIDNRPPPGFVIHEFLVFKVRDGIGLLSRDGESKLIGGEANAMHWVLKQNLSKGQTTLIFVGSRPEAETIAKNLKDLHIRDPMLSEEVQNFLRRDFTDDSDLTAQLMALAPYGIAFHHAGMRRKLRKFVERLMKENRLKTVVATTTLSHGVDYQIDNVIIDIHGLDKVRRGELERYEYINLKGRTGRPGKSKSASVYILTSEQLVDKCFNRLFLSSPEAVYPDSPLNEDQVASVVTSIPRNGVIKPANIAGLISETLSARHHRTDRELLGKVMAKLSKSGFITRSGEDYKLTDYGEKIVEIGLSPEEAASVLRIKPNASDRTLLDTASNIGLARSVRRDRSGIVEDYAVEVLQKWIEGTKLKDILKSLPPPPLARFQDQDILTLVKYTTSSIRKMQQVVSNPKLLSSLSILEKRVRFGIREAETRNELLESLPCNTDEDILLTRSVVNAGYTTVAKIRQEDPKLLATKMGIGEGLVNEIVRSAQVS